MLSDSTSKHLTDQEFFTHIKLFKLLFSNETIENESEYDDGTFKLSNLRIGNEEVRIIYNRINLDIQIAGIKVLVEKGFNFNEDIAKVKEEIQKKPEDERKKLIKIIGKIEKGKNLEINEVSAISWVWYEVFNYIKFKPFECKIPEIEKVFKMEIDNYLDNFINDKLSIIKHNYFKFEIQKKALIKLIEDDKKINLYGSNFIIKEKINKKGFIIKSPEFAIAQTVYALEKMGYLDVVNIWEGIKFRTDYAISENDIARYIKVNVILKQPFIDEINENFREDNPKVYFEKYDEIKKVLRISGKNISLAKKGKDTDGIRLLETLLKDKRKTWWNDEVFEYWGYKIGDEKSKNKLYHASKSFNKNIKDATGIEDFIEHTTMEFKINQRYLKVDE
jgi:hypothetical protein